MNLHEYQSKQLLRHYEIPVPNGSVLTERSQAEALIGRMGEAVVKAQIHAGGRGKAGGVRIVRSLDQAMSAVDDLLGKPLVTAQTAPEGELVEALYFEQILSIRHELYLSYVFNRDRSCVTCILSTSGGMDIEAVAEEHPEAVARFDADPLIGPQEFQIRTMLIALGIEARMGPAVTAQIHRLIRRLYEIYVERDLSLLEINPLAVTDDGVAVAADAKITIDDNALYRQTEALCRIGVLNRGAQAEPTPAEKLGLSYIQLDGDVGCLVNGAGLAMATMDAISFAGGRPANFLDIGGSADAAKIAEAIGIMLEDKNTRGVLINVFGGINRCDVIADGVVRAITAYRADLPFVVRLQGKNYEEGLRIVRESGFDIHITDSMEQGADRIVRAIAARRRIAGLKTEIHGS